MMRRQLVVATRNEGKLRELSAMLQGLDLTVMSLQDFTNLPAIPEKEATFRENAISKARFVYERVGIPTIADDSGLEVDALNGLPGIFSARFAGANATDADNIAKLLRSLEGVPLEKRKAQFKCVLALMLSKEEVYVTEGICTGVIAETPRGAGGFGYDPVFLLPELSKTLAELSAEEKNQLSHRGKAMRKMRTIILEKLLVP